MNNNEFPELSIDDEKSYRCACNELTLFFRQHKMELERVCITGREVERCYDDLESYFHNHTEAICHRCLHPCCVNRHGFPDFEDLVFFNAMGFEIPDYNLQVHDTDMCQFLTENGCSLPRSRRSYRCTWYFCDTVLDRFRQKNRVMFRQFDDALSRLGTRRNILLRQFGEIWSGYDHH